MVYEVKDIARDFNVHEDSVLAWIETGELVAVNVGKGPNKLRPRWRIRQKDLDAFMESRATNKLKPKAKPRRKRTAPSKY